MTKILVSARISPEVTEALKEIADVEVSDRAKKRFLEEDDLIEKLRGVDILITEADNVTAKVLENSPDLKLVATCRGNPVNVDSEAATKLGVLVSNTPGRNAVAVAELNIMLMVACARHAFPAYEGLMDGSWHTGPRGWAYFTFQGIELESRTVGLVGLGAIGFELVKRLQAFGMTCIAYDPYVDPQRAADAGVELNTLEDVFSRADFVSMHAAVTEETKGLIGREQFALMKPEAYFINTARAVLVDEEAMIEALREKRIAGAGLDVFHEEPLPPDNPLCTLDNVVVLPHIGGATADVVRHHADIVYEDIVALIEGRTPVHLFNKDALPAFRARFGEAALAE